MGGRRHKGHGHHGGAWKVAYADFVTAMMALFMILWIVSQDEVIKVATTKYFQNPFNSVMENSSGVMDGGQGLWDQFESEESKGNSMSNGKMQALANEMLRMMDVQDSPDSNPIDVQVTSDGVRLTVYDRGSEPLFEPGSDDLTEWGEFVMQNLAWIMERHDLKVRIDAHANAGEQSADSPFELTSDRANAARAMLEHFALSEEKIERVTGFGATRPIDGKLPEEQDNRRLELSLSFD